ncbi:MAG: hypothetical protein QXH91_08710 [Candidatus Bathyarchaeia archaeon]
MQEKGGKKIERDSIKLKDSLKELVSLDVEGVQDVPLTEMLSLTETSSTKSCRSCSFS